MSSYCGEIFEIFHGTDIYTCRLIVEKSSKYFAERTYICRLIVEKSSKYFTERTYIFLSFSDTQSAVQRNSRGSMLQYKTTQQH